MFRARHIVLGAAFLMTAALAWSADNKLPDKARAILAKADQVELYSLDPVNPVKKGEKGFHDWKVLGKTALKRDARKRVLAALEKGIAESKGEAAKCFQPRHGIRATDKGKTVDLVICFECLQVYVYYDKTEKRDQIVLTTRSPEPTLDKALKDAGVRLAEKPAK
jgi:hypothetical protein